MEAHKERRYPTICLGRREDDDDDDDAAVRAASKYICSEFSRMVDS